MYLSRVKISRNWLRIFGLVVLVVILVKLDLRRVLEIITKVDIIILAIPLCSVIPLKALHAWRWRYLLGMQGISLSLRKSFLVYLAASYVGALTPARAGEFIKAFYLREEKKMSLGEGFSNILIDRLQDVSAFAIVGLIGLSLAPSGGAYLYSIMGIALLFLVTWAFLFRAETTTKKIFGVLVRSLVPERYRSSIDTQLDSFFMGIGKLSNPRIIVPALATAALMVIVFFQCYLIAASLSISISFVYLAFCVSVAGLVSLIPISISGLGTREATMIVLFSRVGLSSESAVSFSLTYLLVFHVSSAIMGALIWFISPVGRNFLEALEKGDWSEPPKT